MRVTPPDPAILGTGCHIDVQGWIGDQLIGGIRKLDVPPVNLPHADPPWLEKEISTVPTPPISGTVNLACIELQNPLGFTRTVTVTFSEAVFGAGIPFTPIHPTQTFTLPPNSLQKYCVNWTADRVGFAAPLPAGDTAATGLPESNQPAQCRSGEANCIVRSGKHPHPVYGGQSVPLHQQTRHQRHLDRLESVDAQVPARSAARSAARWTCTRAN